MSDGEGEACEEAVLKWYNYGGSGRVTNNSRELSSKAKRYLSSKGWILWYAEKNGKKELRYRSPNGKNYYSLKTACKGYIDEGLGDGRIGNFEPKEPKEKKCSDLENLSLKSVESESPKIRKLPEKHQNLVVKLSKPKPEHSGDAASARKLDGHKSSGDGRIGNLETKEPKNRKCLYPENRLSSTSIESESPKRRKLLKKQDNLVVQSGRSLSETEVSGKTASTGKLNHVLLTESNDGGEFSNEGIEVQEEIMQELYKEITIPSGEEQEEIMQELYKEIIIPSNDTSPPTVTLPLPSSSLSSSSLLSSAVIQVNNESCGASLSDSSSAGNAKVRSPEREEENEIDGCDYEWLASVLNWEEPL